MEAELEVASKEMKAAKDEQDAQRIKSVRYAFAYSFVYNSIVFDDNISFYLTDVKQSLLRVVWKLVLQDEPPKELDCDMNKYNDTYPIKPIISFTTCYVSISLHCCCCFIL